MHCQAFFPWYNDEHRHTGLAIHTPADVHYGTAAITHQKRAGVLDAAYAATPQRFVRKPPEPPSYAPEQLSIPVDQDLLRGLLRGRFVVGAFDEFAVLELGAGSDQCHQVGCVHGAPA